MGCCNLDAVDYGPTEETNGLIWKVCRDCAAIKPIKVKLRIYPISGGNAEMARARCPRCGKSRTFSPKHMTKVEYQKYNIVSDWIKERFSR